MTHALESLTATLKDLRSKNPLYDEDAIERLIVRMGGESAVFYGEIVYVAKDVTRSKPESYVVSPEQTCMSVSNLRIESGILLGDVTPSGPKGAGLEYLIETGAATIIPRWVTMTINNSSFPTIPTCRVIEIIAFDCLII